jgi:hypothetical protein
MRRPLALTSQRGNVVDTPVTLTQGEHDVPQAVAGILLQ